MPNLHYRGRLGERWRILLDETNTGWHASLLDRLDSATSDLGDYEHFGQAKRESAAKARQVLADRNLEDPGPVLDWQKIPQLVTLEPDGSFRRWAGILSGLIGALSLGVTIVLALTGTGNRSA